MLKRFAFVAIFGAAVVAGGALLPMLAGAAQGTLRVASAQAGVGQTADITLSTSDVGAPGLGSWTIDVNYDAAIVAVVGCQAMHGGICNDAFAANAVRVAGISLAGLVGDSDLASISFRCEQAGVSLLGISIDVFSDASLGEPQAIDSSILTGSLTCSEQPPPTATPVPPTPTEIPASPPASEPDKVPGDADCDEDIDSIDAAHVLQFEARLLDEIACPENADANHDGRVGPIDAAIILQISAGLFG